MFSEIKIFIVCILFLIEFIFKWPVIMLPKYTTRVHTIGMFGASDGWRGYPLVSWMLILGLYRLCM